jgi:hypothetical protein
MPVNICKTFTHTKQAALGVVSVFLLCLGFYANTWKVAKEGWFGFFEHYSESLVVGRIVKSRQDGLFSAGGLLGRGFPEKSTQRYYALKHSREELIKYQYEAYIEGDSFDTYTTYDSQTGGQAAFFSLLDKTLPQSPRAKLALFYLLNSLLAACILAILVQWFYLEFDIVVAVSVLATMIFSQWLVVFGRNIFWSLWAFYLPMVMVMYFLRRNRAGTNLHPIKFTSLVFVGVLLKIAFNGYEYITSALIMLLVPVVFYCALDGRNMRWFLRHTLLAGLASGGAMLLGMVILCFQIASVKGDLLSGVNHILFVLMKRTHANAVDFPPEYTASLQAGMGEVLWKYLQGTFFDINNYIATQNTFISTYLFNIRYGYLLVIFIIVSILLLARKGVLKHGIERSRCTALVITAWFSILAPISWYLIFKAHSYIHTHMDFIVWQMPFTIFGFALCGLVVSYALPYPNPDKPEPK